MHTRILHSMTIGLALATGITFADAEEPASAIGGGAHKHHTQPSRSGPDDPKTAPKLLNLGSHTFPVSTRNSLAQQYINQGLNIWSVRMMSW